MPGQERLSIDQLIADVAQLVERGIGGILLFGIAQSHEKDACGTAAFDEEGVVQQAVRALKQAYPDFLVIADVCVCAYTDHGHCGHLPMKATWPMTSHWNRSRKPLYPWLLPVLT